MRDALLRGVTARSLGQLHHGSRRQRKISAICGRVRPLIAGNAQRCKAAGARQSSAV